MTKRFELKKADILLIFAIIVISMFLIGIIILNNPYNVNREVVIRIDNKVVKRVTLASIKESKQYKFEFNNNIGYIEIEDGKVRMLEMDNKICPEAICSDTGWIDKLYQSIVCLPNKIIVTIEG